MSAIQFYHDDLVVRSFLRKNAQDSSLISAITTYFSNNYDSNNPAKSIINDLAPGVVFNILSKGLGFTGIGFVFSVAMRIFHIDIYSILQSIYDQIVPTLSQNNKFTSDKVHQIVKSSVESSYKEPPGTQASKIREAILFKAALEDYKINKNAGILGNPPISLLTSILSWFFEIALASAGFMVAGDAINKVLNRPNAFDSSYQEGKTPPAPFKEQTAIINSTQTKYPVKSSYTDTKYNQGTPWSINASNTPEGIENMLIDFANEVYDIKDNPKISNSTAFNVLKARIVAFNKSSEGDNLVFIPQYLKSKKEIVDTFIDEVAKSK